MNGFSFMFATFCIPLHPIRTVVYSMILSAALPGPFPALVGREKGGSISYILRIESFLLSNKSAAVHSVLLIIVHWR